MSNTVQDILDIVDHYLGDYGEYVYATFSGDASSTVFTMNTPIEYHSETITVGGAAKTRDVDYTVNHDNGEITFTTAPASATDNIIIRTTKQNFPLSTKIEGIKNALGKYYYRAVSTSLDMTQDVSTLDISSLSAVRVYAVEYADSDGDYYGNAIRGWFTNTEINPTTLYFGKMPGDTLSLMIRYTKKYTRTLTTPASVIDSNFPTECFEILALWAAVYCLQNMRIKRVTDVNLPAVANDYMSKPSDHRLIVNDLMMQAKDRESEYYHLLKPPISRQVRV